MDLFVRPNNPKLFTLAEKQRMAKASLTQVRALTAQLRKEDHRGTALEYDSDPVKIVTFDANGIKSATTNNGDFSASNLDIRFSRSLGSAIGAGLKNMADLQLLVGYQVADSF